MQRALLRLQQIVCIACQHLLQRRIEIDDGAVGIGDHHVGADAFQRGANAQVAPGIDGVAFGTLAQLDGHVADGLMHAADFVITHHLGPVSEVAAAGNG